MLSAGSAWLCYVIRFMLSAEIISQSTQLQLILNNIWIKVLIFILQSNQDIISGEFTLLEDTPCLLPRYGENSRPNTLLNKLYRLALPLGLLGVAMTAQADELEITLPNLNVAEYHAPYVAAWLADERGKRVVDIAVWYDTDMANNEGEKWLKDLRMWWRRSGRSASMPIDGVSGATRRPGTSTIALDGRFDDVAAGDYFIWVEAARELGGRETLKVPVSLPVKQTVNTSAEGQHELSSITLHMEPAQ